MSLLILGQEVVEVEWFGVGVMAVFLCVSITLAVVAIVLRFMDAVRRWKMGLWVSGVILFLNWPQMWLMISGMAEVVEYPVLIVGIGLMICFVVSAWLLAWRLFVYGAGAASWLRVHEGGYVLLDQRMLGGRGRDKAWRRVFAGFGIGVLMCAVTIVAFAMMGVEMGDVLRQMVEQDTDRSTQVTGGLEVVIGVLSFITVAAIGEELMFRGLLLPWLAELFGWKPGKETGFWVSVLLVSFLWAVIHWPNTNMPAVKLTQIFLVSLVFCWMARKWGVESAIAGHLGLNWPTILFVS
ncbi:CAAX amino terminal protease self- immunity [Poriferisphaera corsica]|uniref:CAAX amino terminal protease self-immunity n=1 Tax=Poriferisphaera corsica TaxID=2528020 RepID=A0A517YRZ7_9BACT|nr:type II CAAX endopeptidase family protein [Poriferisphaera corsica]QDU32995.1 CAAX amino terminal protease self- immunity [Poriferisphaera corsica]